MLIPSANAQTRQARTPSEFAFVSDTTYQHPIKDVQTIVTFTSPDGVQTSVDMFWDGGKVYKARFAPPTSGLWSYCSSCSDTMNAGLHNKCSQFSVLPYDGDNVFGINGPITISENSKNFVHQNNKPFFMLVDAVLELSWKSTSDEIDAYISDRSSKGFNTAWVVPMSHQYFYPHGVRNKQNEEYFIDGDHSLLNPRYFDYLDSVVNKLNEAGIVVLLNPIWGRMSSTYLNSVHQHAIDIDTALIHARYIGARYGGNNIVWLIAGDAQYESQESKDYWNDFADELDRASGKTHLMTAHATGYRGSYYYFADSPWIDFHTYTPSHSSKGSFNWRGAVQATSVTNEKPVVNIEYNFEDLYDEFWNYFTDTTGVKRLTDEHVRLGAWQGLLSGAVGGTSYGGNGLWQWANPETLRGFGVRRTAIDALALPGSAQLGNIKEYLEDLSWYTLTRVDDLIIEFDSPQQVVASTRDSMTLAYLPANTKRVLLDTSQLGDHTRLTWRDPGTLETIEVDSVFTFSSTLELIPPTQRDWLVEITQIPKTASPVENLRPQDSPFVTVFPNPSSASFFVNIESENAISVNILVVDALGRTYVNDELQISNSISTVRIRVDTPGAYFLRCNVTHADGSISVRHSSLVRVQ